MSDTLKQFPDAPPVTFKAMLLMVGQAEGMQLPDGDGDILVFKVTREEAKRAAALLYSEVQLAQVKP